ncbi:MAG TPA: AAA family ATPase [Solirubrobacterales bacterium]|nr:AAA family ATPase [Solirubrobacterales bacterium]
MTRESGDRAAARASRGLLILTGASHTGKTSVARSILDLKGSPAALLGVDQTLEHTLVRPPGDRWNEIPLAYELISLQTEALLRAGWFIVLESTFTHVPEEGPPEFHGGEIERLVEIALAAGAPWSIVQLNAAESTVIERAEASCRLPLAIVTKTIALHRGAAMPAGTIQLQTESNPRQLAQSILAGFPH